MLQISKAVSKADKNVKKAASKAKGGLFSFAKEVKQGWCLAEKTYMFSIAAQRAI